MSDIWRDANQSNDGAAPKPKGFSEEHLKIMGDYLTKQPGHAASGSDAVEALTNLTRLFQWLYKHRNDLRRDAH